MRQKHWIILACLAIAALITLNLVLSNSHQNQLAALSQEIADMAVKMDEMDVQLESLTSSVRLTNSAVNGATQRISDRKSVV